MKNSAEDTVAEVLRKNNIEFQQQYGIDKYTVDFFLEKENVVLEFYGCFYHGCKKCYPNQEYVQDSVNGMLKPIDIVRQRDKKRETVIKNKGYRFYVLWAHDLKNDWIHDFKKLLLKEHEILRDTSWKRKIRKGNVLSEDIVSKVTEFLNEKEILYTIVQVSKTDSDIHVKSNALIISIRDCENNRCAECGYVSDKEDEISDIIKMEKEFRSKLFKSGKKVEFVLKTHDLKNDAWQEKILSAVENNVVEQTKKRKK